MDSRKRGFAGNVFRFFSQSGLTTSPSAPVDPLEEIRAAMLELMGDEIHTLDAANLVRRLRLAADITDLWYARAGLMSVLATQCNEAEARRKIIELNTLFEGLIPPSFVNSRPRLNS